METTMQMEQDKHTDGPVAISLFSLWWIFLRIGMTAFGGFMALISVVEQTVVERRRWLRHDDMLDGISLASMLPGPVAVNVVAYVGYRLRGYPGAAVAWAAVLLPSFILIVGLSFAYFRWGGIPAVQNIFKGFMPAVAAIVFSTAWGMARKTVGTLRETAILFVSLFVLLRIGGVYSTVLIVILAGVAGWVFFRSETASGPPMPKNASSHFSLKPVLALLPVFAAPFAPATANALVSLFLVFAGMSIMLFGGGYVFVPMIQEIVVKGHGWVTQTEFVNGIALGQITPGPILISAAFIGYKLAGVTGALAGTVGIFLPPAVIMVTAASILERIKASRVLRAAMRGIRPAVIGMIFAAVVVIAGTAPDHWASFAIFAATLFALERFRIDVVWLIPIAGLAGLVVHA
jgi:chromate transporter